jgi:hypothetical protein
VGVVDVSHHVEEKFLDLSENLVKIGGELMAVLGREQGLIINRFLNGTCQEMSINGAK